jgi:hypothetical protein
MDDLDRGTIRGMTRYLEERPGYLEMIAPGKSVGEAVEVHHRICGGYV